MKLSALQIKDRFQSLCSVHVLKQSMDIYAKYYSFCAREPRKLRRNDRFPTGCLPKAEGGRGLWVNADLGGDEEPPTRNCTVSQWGLYNCLFKGPRDHDQSCHCVHPAPAEKLDCGSCKQCIYFNFMLFNLPFCLHFCIHQINALMIFLWG